MMLAVAAIHHGHLQQARDILSELSREFPGNRLNTHDRDRIR
jgi:hypothetical protein